MSEIDLEGMDTFFSEITHNGSRCSHEFANWGEWHLDNWKAIKAEVERLRARVKELEGYDGWSKFSNSFRGSYVLRVYHAALAYAENSSKENNEALLEVCEVSQGGPEPTKGDNHEH